MNDGATEIPAADWHLLVGDAAALPDIGAALERIPEGRAAIAVLELEDLAERVRLTSPGGLTVHWLHASGGSLDPGSVLISTVRALEFPAGPVHAFIRGEIGWVRALARHLLFERGVGRHRLSMAGHRRAPAGHTPSERG